jgi:hypothetical protein
VRWRALHARWKAASSSNGLHDVRQKTSRRRWKLLRAFWTPHDARQVVFDVRWSHESSLDDLPRPFKGLSAPRWGAFTMR